MKSEMSALNSGQSIWVGVGQHLRPRESKLTSSYVNCTLDKFITVVVSSFRFVFLRFLLRLFRLLGVLLATIVLLSESGCVTCGGLCCRSCVIV